VSRREKIQKEIKEEKKKKKKNKQTRTHHPCKTPSWARLTERKANALFVFQRGLIFMLTR